MRYFATNFSIQCLKTYILRSSNPIRSVLSLEDFHMFLVSFLSKTVFHGFCSELFACFFLPLPTQIQCLPSSGRPIMRLPFSASQAFIQSFSSSSVVLCILGALHGESISKKRISPSYRVPCLAGAQRTVRASCNLSTWWNPEDSAGLKVAFLDHPHVRQMRYAWQSSTSVP